MKLKLKTFNLEGKKMTSLVSSVIAKVVILILKVFLCKF